MWLVLDSKTNPKSAANFLNLAGKGIRSFYARKMGSEDQRASKLLAFKVGGLKKKSAAWPQPHLNQSARIRVRPRSNHSQSLMNGNFAAL